MRRARKTPLPGNASLSEWRFPLSECHCRGRGPAGHRTRRRTGSSRAAAGRTPQFEPKGRDEGGEIASGAMIEVGETTLRFQAFRSEDFDWPDVDD